MPIMGTQPEAIDLAEDRRRFSAVLDELGIAYPAAGTANTLRRGRSRSRGASASRCSCGRATCSAGAAWSSPTTSSTSRSYMAEATQVSPDHPVLLDRFLEGAIEVDVDAVCDGETVYIGGVMEHIEEAGIHSGDSAC